MVERIKRCVRLTVLPLFFILNSSPTLAKNEPPAVLQGKWSIASFIIPGPSALDAVTAEFWLGKPLYYGKQEAGIVGKTCRTPVYRIREISVDEFYEMFRFLPDKLIGEQHKLMHVEIHCDKNGLLRPGGDLIVLDQSRIYMVWDGVFFRLEKATR